MRPHEHYLDVVLFVPAVGLRLPARQDEINLRDCDPLTSWPGNRVEGLW